MWKLFKKMGTIPDTSAFLKVLPKKPSEKRSEGGKAMAKTGSNIYRRKDGRYEGRVLHGKTVYQKPRYIYVYGKTLKEVKEKMRMLKEAQKTVEGGDELLIRDCAQEWLEKKKGQWKPTTYDTYRRLLDRYVIPILGNYRVEEVTVETLEAFLEEIRKNSDKLLTEAYLKYVCALVRQILEFASEQKKQPLLLPPLPEFQIKKRNTELPSDREFEILKEFLTEHVEDETCLGIMLAMYTGIRIGELCALRWKNVDFSNGCLMISSNLQRVRIYEEDRKRTRVCSQMPKTLQSVRAVPLPDSLLQILKDRKQDPEAYLIPGRKNDWTDVRTLQYRFTGILKKCGIEPFRFHMLRHAFASRCIWQGCDIKSLSEVLGHSSVQITMDIYVHSSMKQKKDMINLVCDLNFEPERSTS